VKAVPGAGIDVPVWILGSSTYSAHLAAAMGLPYAFASHFAPGDLLEALAIYRTEFTPALRQAQGERREYPDKPHVMVGVPFVAAASDERAQHLSTTMIQRSLGILRGQRTALLPPVAEIQCGPAERAALAERMALFVVGGPARVAEGLQHILDVTAADELILVSETYDRADRLESFRIAAELKA
jgi:luciferase family oxidoreductase group 1